MAAVLGVESGTERAADAAARSLGGAMQLTNILRDVVADAGVGRVYLPAESLATVGVERPDGVRALRELEAWPLARRRALMAPLIARADAEYATGLRGLAYLRSGRLGVRIAGHLYREILREIERDGYGGRPRRAVVPRWRKARIVAGVALATAR
jgi:phytoene synthase